MQGPDCRVTVLCHKSDRALAKLVRDWLPGTSSAFTQCVGETSLPREVDCVIVLLTSEFVNDKKCVDTFAQWHNEWKHAEKWFNLAVGSKAEDVCRVLGDGIEVCWK